MRFLLACAVAGPLALTVHPALGQGSCGGGPAVALAVELYPPEPDVRERLRQQLEAELAARNVSVCPQVPGVQLLARIRVRAIPELSLAVVSIETDARGELVRSLEVDSLPREARPSAIATATDELLAAWLAVPEEPAAPPPEPARGSSPPPAVVARAPQPRAFGVVGAVARFRDFATAYGAEVRARSWATPRWLLTFAFGGSTASYRLPRHPAQGALPLNDEAGSLSTPDGARYVEWHVGVDAGYELLPPGASLGLRALSGVSLHRSTLQLTYASDSEWRLGFPGGFTSSAAGFGFSGTDGTDRVSGWDGLGHLGLEGSWRPGAVQLSASVIGLLPLSSTHADELELADGTYTPRRGLGAHWGVELGLAAWYLFE